MGSATNNRGGFGRIVTPVLAIIAAMVLGLVIHRAASRGPGGSRLGDAATANGEATGHASKGARPPGTRPLFTDITRESGLVFEHVCGAEGEYWLPEEMGSGGAFFDYDNDGDTDVYLVQSGKIGTDNAQHRNRLFRNDGTGRFEDVSAGSGADVPGYGMGCAAADYDNDGDVDLYITHLGPNVLLRNNGDGTFTDVTRRAGVGDEGFGTAAAFADFDRDGFLDLYVANYVEWSPQREETCYDATGGVRDYCNPRTYPPAADRMYRNLGDGRFEDVTQRAARGVALGNGLGVVCSDFDGDGWVDIYVANDQTPAFLWISQKDGTFREDALLSGCAFNADGVAIAGMGVAAEDLDDDADYDLVVTNIREQAHLCLRNDGGFFEDVSHEMGFDKWGVPYTGFGIGLFDQDHDGRLDGFVVNGAVNKHLMPLRPGHPLVEPNQFLRRDSAGRFFDASAEAGPALEALQVSRGAILGDCDNDGDIDVLVTNNRGPARLLRNNCAGDNAWTMLDLISAGGGRNALNARIELQAGGKTWRREVRPHVGYLGSNDPRIHVGLGQVQVIRRLSITWPDGTDEVWHQISVNRHLVVRQSQPPRPAGANIATKDERPR